jgi:phenylalanyl-tRNA synthetase beta chain
LPTIEVDFAEFVKLLDIELERDTDRVNEVLAFAKGETKSIDEKTGLMSVEIKDTNRADLWNVEGLVRCLRGFLGLEKGLRKYTVGNVLAEVHVDGRLKRIRPFIACSVVKNLNMTDAIIRDIMQLQEKLDHTYGRSRRRASIGFYDFDLIRQPFSYTVAKPDEVSFVPLGLDKSLSLREILREHPKGVEYGSIVSGNPVYPILFDSGRKVLSFPPVINSNDLGRVTENTRNILVEVTGTVHETVLNTLKIVTLSLADRGGKVHSALVHYEADDKEEATPSFDAGRAVLNVGYANKMLDLDLSARQIAGLLEKAGYGVLKLGKDEVVLKVPCYRVDIMHQVDLVEDVAIAYGYNNLKPFWRKLPTTGEARPEQSYLDVLRELMVGLGYQEVLTYDLTNPDNLFTKMNLKRGKVVELTNPKVETLTCLRSWLLPGLMEFFSCNLHVEFPQRIFELGPVTILDDNAETSTRDVDTLAVAVSDVKAGFTEVKSALDALLTNLGLEWQIKETDHSSFIDGRVGTVIIDGVETGLMGEVHPKVLQDWGLGNPVAAFELDVDKVRKPKKRITSSK